MATVHTFSQHFSPFGSLAAQIFIPYHRYVRVLKWLTLSLFAYVAVVFIVKVDWPEVMLRIIWPRFEISGAAIVMIVAIFGTTISPYLFFWQSSEEVEDVEADPEAAALVDRPEQAPKELRRIEWDTYVGMGFSNLIAFFIILTTAVTLNTAGKTDIETSAQAAEALRPLAGDFAFALFSMGIVGTGLLAIPVLAGSAAYATSEALGWNKGLERSPKEAIGFYSIIGLSVVLGVIVVFSPLDPMKALFWNAVLNGIISVPIMAAMMVVASSKRAMGKFTATLGQRIFGWAATGVMAAAAIAMVIFQ